MLSKLQTAIVVLLLSCLIWVFAERAVTKEETVDITISLDEVNRNGNLLVQFLDDMDNPVPLKQKAVTLTVRGPAARVLEVKQAYISNLPMDPSRLGIDNTSIVEQEKMVAPVINLMGKGLDSLDGKSFLQVVRAEPPAIRIRVTRLVAQKVPVAVYDEKGGRLVPQMIEPAEIDGFVVSGEPFIEAMVKLTPDQQLQALQQDITVTTALAYPHRGQGDVKLRLKQAINLTDDKIRLPRLCIQKPFSMENEYQVVIEDVDLKLETQRYSPLEIRGTSEACKAYRETEYHLILKITELDRSIVGTEISRPLEYFIPASITGLEIVNKEARPIKFKLGKMKTDERLPATAPTNVIDALK